MIIDYARPLKRGLQEFKTAFRLLACWRHNLWCMRIKKRKLLFEHRRNFKQKNNIHL